MNQRVRINLAYLRVLRRKVSQTEISQATGISQSTLSILESGRTNSIDFNTLVKLCDFFDCTPNDILIIESARNNQSSVEEQIDCSPIQSDLLGEHEKKVYELITPELIHFDVLAERSGMQAGPLSASLTMLELAGAIRRVSGDWYKR